MSGDKRVWDAEYVNRKLAGLGSLKTEHRRELPVTGYHLAAAVLSSFDPEELNPVGPAGYEEFKQLLADSTVLPARPSAAWTLLPAVRQRSLRALAQRGGILAALQANDVQKDSLGQVLSKYVDGTVPDVERQSLDQLLVTLQVLNWFKDDQIRPAIPPGVLRRLPSEDQVRGRIELERLLKPFRDLVGDTFRGRASELATLSDFVGFLQATTRLEVARRGVRDILSLTQEPPLLITGPGGVGKSTLIAKFILDHVDIATGRIGMRPQTEMEVLSFAYLDLNRPDLRVEEPATLLLEIVKQLGIVVPYGRKMFEELALSWKQRAPEDAKASSSLSLSTGAWQPLIAQMSALLQSMGSAQMPLLLVIDNFEDAQYRGRELVFQVWDVLNSLQQEIPRLRTVLAGRSEITEFPTKILLLSDFDREAAAGFLQARGIKDEDVALQVVDQIGGNPLSLRLAAELVTREGTGALHDVNTRRLFFFKLSSVLVQGQLYRRILDHLHDERVRRLAHPGLVVRRVTPEVILRVLAGPCEVSVEGIDDAERIFDEFRREVSLVWEASDGSLHHRSDVRRMMLAQLVADQQDKVRLIHENAVRFYTENDDVVSRAEEIYHRLSLGQSDESTAIRFIEGVDEYLRDAVQELPPRSQAFLASRIGLELDSSIWKEADLQSWELQAAARVERWLTLNRAEDALKVFRERTERSETSPLYRLEALAYEQLADANKSQRDLLLNQARSIISKAVAPLGKQGDLDALRLDNLVIAARLDEKVGAQISFEDALTEFEILAGRYAGDPKVIAVTLHRIRLFQKQADAAAAVRQLYWSVIGFIDSIPDERIANHAGIFVDLASQVILVSPETVVRLVRRVGFRRMFSTSFRERFLKAIQRTWNEYSDYGTLVAESMESLTGKALPSPLEDTVVSVLREQQGLSPEAPILSLSLLEIASDPKSIRKPSADVVVVDIGPFDEGSVTEPPQ